MESVNTIVVALDLAAGSEAVLARAARLASDNAAWLLVLHVIEAEPLAHAAALAGTSENELRGRLHQEALAALGRLAASSGRSRRTEARVEFGQPHEVIARAVRDESADLLVIGPGKSRSLREKILGSTADRLVRTSPAPVLIVRAASAEPYRRVAVAVDFSPQSARAVTEVRRLVPEAAVRLVHAADIPLGFAQAMLRAGSSQAEMDAYHAARAAKAREELAAFARKVADTGTLAVRVVEGAPATALVRLSKSGRIDLLAMGSHGRGAALQALLGSVARTVLAQAGCDVLVVGDPP